MEPAGSNFSAYVPDLPVCVATAATREAIFQEIRIAIAFHLEGLKADSESQPTTQASVATMVI
ncbi:MAG: type II toxin-antitoxin system HicB family antitoxin [Synechococcus sp.]|nr:type II toxin-antitoxin system HicB family antitoxin [Synechococcus sp.]